MRQEILLIAHLTSLWMVSSFIKFCQSNQVTCFRVSEYHGCKWITVKTCCAK